MSVIVLATIDSGDLGRLGSMGLWVCGSVRVYGSMGLWVCGSMGLWVCGSVGLWVCGSVGLWVCGSVGLWVCGSVGLWDGEPAHHNGTTTQRFTTELWAPFQLSRFSISRSRKEAPVAHFLAPPLGHYHECEVILHLRSEGCLALTSSYRCGAFWSRARRYR
jgi:hypothetical protein